jgi:hypothetical protein
MINRENSQILIFFPARCSGAVLALGKAVAPIPRQRRCRQFLPVAARAGPPAVVQADSQLQYVGNGAVSYQILLYTTEKIMSYGSNNMVKLSRQPNPFLGPRKQQQLQAASAQSKSGKNLHVCNGRITIFMGLVFCEKS